MSIPVSRFPVEMFILPYLTDTVIKASVLANIKFCLQQAFSFVGFTLRCHRPLDQTVFPNKNSNYANLKRAGCQITERLKNKTICFQPFAI